MDIDFQGPEYNKAPTAPTPPPPPPPESTKHSLEASSPQDDRNKKINWPYLATLTSAALLLLSALYSVIGLVTYVVGKWLVKDTSSSDSLFDVSTFENYAVIFEISALVIVLPMLVLLILKLRQLESRQTWRISQKWRRIVYTVLSVVLVLSFVSALVGVVYQVLSNQLHLSELDSYSYYDTAKEDTAGMTNAAIVSGLISAVLIAATLASVVFEYANKWRKVIWIFLGSLATIGLVLSVISIGHVNKAVEDAKKKPEINIENDKSLYSDSSTSSDSNNPLYESSISTEGELVP